MSEVNKCCGCCANNNKELNNEELEKVTGGNEWDGLGRDAHLVNGRYICTTWRIKGHHSCPKNKTVDGINNVCTCLGKTDGHCCRVYGDKCTCSSWDKISKDCYGNE